MLGDSIHYYDFVSTYQKAGIGFVFLIEGTMVKNLMVGVFRVFENSSCEVNKLSQDNDRGGFERGSLVGLK